MTEEPMPASQAMISSVTSEPETTGPAPAWTLTSEGSSAGSSSASSFFSPRPKPSRNEPTTKETTAPVATVANMARYPPRGVTAR